MPWKSFQDRINACLTKPPGLHRKIIDIILFENSFIFSFIKYGNLNSLCLGHDIYVTSATV